MDREPYSWNAHEQNQKLQGNFTPAKPKMHIVDDASLREKLADGLEELPHPVLARWALSVALPKLAHLEPALRDDPRIEFGIDALEKRLANSIHAGDLRKAGFAVNRLAAHCGSDTSRFSARSFAHAIATGHMRGHALVCSDYAVKVVNSLTEGSVPADRQERQRKLGLLRQFNQTGATDSR